MTVLLIWRVEGAWVGEIKRLRIHGGENEVADSFSDASTDGKEPRCAFIHCSRVARAASTRSGPTCRDIVPAERDTRDSNGVTGWSLSFDIEGEDPEVCAV